MHYDQYNLWVPRVALVLDFIIAAIVIRKRLWRQIPAFSWYLLFGPVSGLFLQIVLTRFSGHYLVPYLVVDVTYKVLNIWVTFEIYSRLMNSFPTLRQFVWRVLWIAGIILLVTCAFIYRVTDFSETPPLFAALNTMGRSFRVVQLGLLSVIFLITRIFNIRLRRYYAFIAIGLVLIDSTEFISLSLVNIDITHFVLVDHIRMMISVLISGMWAIVLYLGEGARAAHAAPNYAASPIAEMDSWNSTLSEIRER